MELGWDISSHNLDIFSVHNGDGGPEIIDVHPSLHFSSLFQGVSLHSFPELYLLHRPLFVLEETPYPHDRREEPIYYG